MKFALDIGLQFYRSAHARSALGYFIANIVSAGIPFLLLPLLTRLMTPQAYGSYSLFTLAISVSMPLVTLMLSSVVVREYTLRDPTPFTRMFSTAALLSIASLLLLTAGCFALKPHLETLSHLPIYVIILALLYALAQGILTIMQGIATMQKKPLTYGYWKVGFTLTCGIAGYIAVKSQAGSWESMVTSQTLVAIVFIAIACAVASHKGWLKATFDKPDAKLALAYSCPLILHALTAGVIVQNADRFFIAQYMTLAEVGSYNVAQQVSLAMYVVVSSINQAWSPWYYEQMKQNAMHNKRRIVLFTYAGFAGLILMGIAATGVLWAIYPYIAGEAFQSGRTIFPWLVLGFVFNGMYMLVATGLFYTGHTMQLMLCNIGTAIINIGLNFWLVPQYGMQGAAIATAASTLCMLLLIWATTARVHRLPWLLRIPSIPESNERAHD